MSIQSTIIATRPFVQPDLLSPLDAPGAQAVDTTATDTNQLQSPDYNRIFEGYRRMCAEFSRALAEQHALERDLIGETVTKEINFEQESDIADRSLAVLIRRAEKQFAPGGGKLSIERYVVTKAMGIADWKDKYRERQRRTGGESWYEKHVGIEKDLDLNQLWAYLDATYGGSAGERVGLQQAAKTIMDFFDLSKEESVTKSKSGVILTARMYSQVKTYGPDAGKYESDYRNAQKAAELAAAIRCFIVHSDTSALQYNQWIRNEFLGTSFCFKPREKALMRGCEISFFKDKWTFKLSAEAAEHLMLFLGEYSSS